MSKQFLNGAQIATIAKQMRGKGVSECMRRHMRWQIETGPQIFDKTLHRARPKRGAAAADK